jgi:hypothetical protein
MRLKDTILPALLLSALFMTSCSTEDGNTTLTIKGDVGTSTARARAAQSITLFDIQGNEFTLTEARVALRHVEFDADSSVNSSYKIEGPFVVDLITGVSVPEIVTPTDSLAGNQYTRIDLRIDDTDDGYFQITPTDKLYGYSLYAIGEHNGTPLEIQLKFNEDIRFDFVSPINVEAYKDHDFALSLKVSEWFAQIDLTDCLNDLSGNDTLKISDDASTCDEVEGDLKTAVKTMYDLDKM